MKRAFFQNPNGYIAVNVNVLAQILPLHSFIYSISCLVKKYMNYDGVCKFANSFIKRNSSKSNVFIEIRN